MYFCVKIVNIVKGKKIFQDCQDNSGATLRRSQTKNEQFKNKNNKNHSGLKHTESMKISKFLMILKYEKY